MLWTLLIVLAALVPLFWGLANVLQTYVYNEPTTGLFWRAPLGAALVTAFLGACCALDAQAIGRNEEPPFDAPFYASGVQTQTFPAFDALNIGPDGKDGKPTHYVRRNRQYQQEKPPYRTWSPTDAIIVRDGDQEVRFDAERDARGNYVRHRKKPPPGLGWLTGAGGEQPLRYIDARGRVMTEDAIGRLSLPRWSMFWLNVLLNLLHLLVWFAVLWLVLRFQWQHGLGIAFVLWAVMTLVFVHMLVRSVEDRSVAAQQGLWMYKPPLAIRECA